MDSTIWGLIIIVSIVIFVVTLITSVSVLHKKFVEKPFEEKDKEDN